MQIALESRFARQGLVPAPLAGRIAALASPLRSLAGKAGRRQVAPPASPVLKHGLGGSITATHMPVDAPYYSVENQEAACYPRDLTFVCVDSLRPPRQAQFRSSQKNNRLPPLQR